MEAGNVAVSATAPGIGPRGIWRGIRIVVLLAAMGYLPWSLPPQWDEFVAGLTLRAVPWIGASFALAVASVLILAVRQEILTRYAGEQLPFRQSVLIAFAGEFANNPLPAGTGSDLIRLLCFRSIGSQTGATAGGLILLDRLVGMASLVFLTFCCVPILTSMVPGSAQLARPLFAGTALLLLGLTVGGASLKIDWIFKTVPHLLRGQSRLGSTLREMLFSLREQCAFKPAVLLLARLAMLNNILGMLMVGGIACGLLSGHDGLQSTLLAPLVMLASAISVTPGNLGWTETIATSSWALFGLRGGLSVFLVRRIVILLVSLLGGLAYGSLKLSKTKEASVCCQ